jgi:DGQHR domain-containing protein
MDFKYLAFVYEQRPAAASAPKFCTFHAQAGEILKWAAIQRLNKAQPQAIQREPKRARILGIKRFLQQDARNTIPSAIVIAIDGAQLAPLSNCTLPGGGALSGDLLKTTIAQLTIRVPDAANQDALPGLVIDGQHRLKGVTEFSPEMRLNVVAILDANENEKAFQFLVINNKAAKVSTDHIRAMVGLTYEETELSQRLKTARLSLDENVGSIGVMDTDAESPFCGLINWPHNVTYEGEKPHRAGFIPPAAIEAAIGYIKSKDIGDLDDAESVDEFFITVWNVVKKEWGNIFNKDSKLLDKVGIVCMTEFLVDGLRGRSLAKLTRFSMANPGKVAEYTKEILDLLEPEFWKVEWKSTSYDTRAGRDQIIEALGRIYGNKGESRQWHHNVDIIKPPEASAANS